MSAGWIGGAVFVAAAAFLAFVGGGVVVLGEIFPSEILRNSYKAGEALLDKETEYLDPFTTDLWGKARTRNRGVTVYDRERAFDGYTFYTSGDGPHAVLISMEGRAVYEWRRPFSSVWHENAAVKDPQADHLIYFRKARVFPNGDLLAIYVAVGDTPWGYGMVKLDRDSNLIWSYLAHTHHDFDVARDGRIFLLTHEFTSERIKHYKRLERPRLDDFLVILAANGTEQKKISLTHALLRSRYKSLLHSIPYFALADPLHTNSVELIGEGNAANFPFGRPGQVLLSFREPGVIAVLDIESETIVWATRGPWLGQHDPSLLESGNILLFDNLGNFQEGNGSQIIEFDPASMHIVWRYVGDEDRPFESAIRSAAQRLPNGNTLITESNGGRLFEVTARGQIAWEYINPVRGGEREEYIPVVSWAQRLVGESFEPGFRALLDGSRAGG